MKKAPVILLLALLLLFPPSFQATAQEQNPDGGAAQGPPPGDKPDPAIVEGEDDIFSTSYERELLSRRFFQKTLPPLGRREKIVWAFKTARANVLL